MADAESASLRELIQAITSRIERGNAPAGG